MLYQKVTKVYFYQNCSQKTILENHIKLSKSIASKNDIVRKAQTKENPVMV
jgi:hypothetical protein